jgi:hypothetical protein
MAAKHYLASLARISDLETRVFEVSALARESWATGDYVVGEVSVAPRESNSIESTRGRAIEVMQGDLVVGALGARAATLGAVGSWEAVGADGVFEALTAAGLFGMSTSVARQAPAMIRLSYQGHVVRGGRKVVMKDFVPASEGPSYEGPIVLIVGTSMEAGKTSAAKVITRLLKSEGLRVVGTKLTGAGRYRDILAMRDAGADAVFDFVDGGLPSTVCSQPEYREALATVLSMIAREAPDVAVAEAGASPLEPYNGAALLAETEERRACTVLCASDPYAAVGVAQGFGIVPDLVAGLATSSEAGVELTRRLTGLEALDVLNPASRPRLRQILLRALEDWKT